VKNCLSFFLLPRPVVRFFISFIVLVGIFSPFVLARQVSANDLGCDPIDGATATQIYCRVGHQGIDGCSATVKCTDATQRGGNSAGYCCDSANPGAPPTDCSDPTLHRVCSTNPGPPPVTDTNKCSCVGFPKDAGCGGKGQVVCKAPLFTPEGSSVPEAGPWELCEPGLYSFTPSGGGSNYCATSQDEADAASGNYTAFVLCATSGNSPQCTSCADSGGVWTAVGCIPTTRKDIVSTFFTIALYLSGGIILLRLLQASFMLSTSQGEPNKVKEAQEIFTSAFAGLLFVLFSMVILSTIGVNILQIPGF